MLLQSILLSISGFAFFDILNYFSEWYAFRNCAENKINLRLFLALVSVISCVAFAFLLKNESLYLYAFIFILTLLFYIEDSYAEFNGIYGVQILAFSFGYYYFPNAFLLWLLVNLYGSALAIISFHLACSFRYTDSFKSYHWIMFAVILTIVYFHIGGSILCWSLITVLTVVLFFFMLFHPEHVRFSIIINFILGILSIFLY